MIVYAQNADAIYLPKWPAMVVRGEKITEERAAEVLVKTDYHLRNYLSRDASANVGARGRAPDRRYHLPPSTNPRKWDLDRASEGKAREDLWGDPAVLAARGPHS